MKLIIMIILMTLTTQVGFGQTKTFGDKKGSIYLYWGWNWSAYSNSTIHFTGDHYDFTLEDVVAEDRPSEFSFNTYFNPTKFTIPQYNFRIGYFFKDNWDISLGVDHMKYVMQQNQTVKMSGHINNRQSKYNGTYENNERLLEEDFLTFEHTDGLNYINVELRHSDKIVDFGKFNVSLQEGLGTGFVLPKTNTALLGKERHDDFHLSGYGIHAVAGLNVAFLNKFYVQTEFKGGFIGLPNVRTTNSTADKASQNFLFTQWNVVLGRIIKVNKKSK